jgi:transposase-like protein
MSKEISNRSKSEWKKLIEEYESRSVTCAYFCKLHKVKKGQVYKWRQYFSSQEKSVSEESEFIPLIINRNEESDNENYSNISSEMRISSSSGVVIEFMSGCRYIELKAIMDILHATK